MATMTLSRLRQARYAILGFGCNQAFLFAMLYLGSYNESSQHGFLIDRADLLCVLLVMAATFAFMTCERPRRHPDGRGRGPRALLRAAVGGSAVPHRCAA